MAFVTFNPAARAVNMAVEDLVNFGSPSPSSGTIYSWDTPDGHNVDLFGSGFIYGADGRATAGRATSAQIDISGDGLNDVQITGLNADAKVLDDGAAAFWNATLSGTTLINAQALTAETTGGFTSVIFGDDFAEQVKFGADDGSVTESGGNDVLTLGTAAFKAMGDAFTVSGGISGGGFFSRYRAGNDQLLARATEEVHRLIGDAEFVGLRGTLIGGNDLVEIESHDSASTAIGDAGFMGGDAAGGKAVVFGGDDTIEASGASQAALSGDVGEVRAHADVTGGDDVITGADGITSIGGDEFIAGDVGSITNGTNVRVVGGDDTIDGGGERDIISGDVLASAGGAAIVGGNDVIRGGDADDRIFGELFNDNLGGGDLSFHSAAVSLTGGNDLLFGDNGDDVLSGQTGNDRLDGGTGADNLDGGAGLDLAGYGSAASGVTADLLAARLNGGDAAGDTFAGIEGLIGSRFADSLRGDNAANRISGGAGADALAGRGGADRLDGGIGNDRLGGGLGNDVFVFAENGDVDRVLDFENGRDRLDLSDFGFSSFAQVSALAANVAGGDLRVDFGGGDVLLLDEFPKVDFTAGDVIL